LIHIPGDLLSAMRALQGTNAAPADAARSASTGLFGELLQGQTSALQGVPGLLPIGGNALQPGGNNLPVLPAGAQPGQMPPGEAPEGVTPGLVAQQQGRVPLLVGEQVGEQAGELAGEQAGADAELLPALAGMPVESTPPQAQDMAALQALDSLEDTPALTADSQQSPTLTPVVSTAELGPDAEHGPSVTVANANVSQATAAALVPPEQTATVQPNPSRQLNATALPGAASTPEVASVGQAGQLPQAAVGELRGAPEVTPAVPRSQMAMADMPVAINDDIAVEAPELFASPEPARAAPSQQGQAQTLSGLPVQAVTESGSTAASKPSLLPPMTVPPGEPEWNAELAGRVSMLVKNGTQEASLQLNPPELGRMDIRIVTEGDQARVQFVVQNTEARDAIEQSLPRLRDMLEQSGLQLARGEVADQGQGRQRESSAAGGVDVDGPVDDSQERPEALISGEWLSGEADSRVDYYV